MLSYTKEGVTLNLFRENRYVAKDNSKTIKLVVCFRRERKYFPTGVSLTDEDFTQLFTCKKKDVLEKRQSLEGTFYKFKAIIDHLLEKNKFSFDNIERQLGVSESLLIRECFEKKIAKLKENNQFGTAQTYDLALKKFEKFDSRKLDLKHITTDWLKKFERYMLENNRSYTIISIYLRCLRAIMNDVITAEKLDRSFYPFGRGKYEIPTGEGRKMALPLQTIKQIFEFESLTDPTISEYKDLWIFSYLCNGANFSDILRLKFKNIDGNEISFFRGKTINTLKKKKTVVAYLTNEMREIINRTGNPVQLPDNYIFPYLCDCKTPEEEFKMARDVIKRTNKRMKRISDALGIPKVTTYTARHSYATVLKRSGANIAFISESLGHTDLKTTENYLASFETEEREKNARLLTSFG
ncbi:MAG: site-specific integrase [Bacteroidales bacterium]|jgi:integrase|nr:site-specific integrase [Bacteroidales bacterium]